MRSKYLSPEEREQGSRAYTRHAFYNGMGFAFLGDTTVFLMAVFFGASNLQLGYISSVIHISGIVLIFLPRLLSGRNLIQIFFVAWLLRGAVCVLYGGLVFLEGQAAVTLILVVYTLFCLSRNAGVVVVQPIQQMLTTASTTGDIVTSTYIRFQTSLLIARFVSFLILSVRALSGLAGLLVIEALGLVTNTQSALALRRIPSRQTVEYRRGRNIFVLFAEQWRRPERLLVILIHWFSLGLLVFLGMIVPFLRREAGLPQSLVFLFTLVGATAMILAGYAVRPFADRVGSRPILAMVLAGMGSSLSVWGMLSADAGLATFFVLGFFTYFFHALIFQLVGRLIVLSIPEDEKIGYTSMLSFFSALFALCFGIASGLLVDLGERSGFANPFRLMFFTAAGLAFLTGFLCLFVREEGSLSLRETANLFFSPRNLKAFLDIYQFNVTEDPEKRQAILLSLRRSRTHLATSEMRRILRTPLSAEKSDVLKALFTRPRNSLLPEVLAEAEDPGSYHRDTAIFTLGSFRDRRTEQLLIRLLDDPDPAVRSTAAKSLARIGHRASFAKVEELSRQDVWPPNVAMNYLIALGIMDPEMRHLERLFRIAAPERGERFRQSCFSLAARTCGMKPSLSDLYREENTRAGLGIEELLEESLELQPIFERQERIREIFRDRTYGEIRETCRDLLSRREAPRDLAHLARGIEASRPEDAAGAGAAAMLYFVIQILRRSA